MIPGDKCPKCGAPLQRRDNMFHWRGESRPGCYCESCNALWVLDGEEIEPLRPIDKPVVRSRDAT